MIKSQLKKISSLVQLLSLETLEEMIKSMRLLNTNILKNDFAQLSVMHAQKCHEILNDMDVDDVVKEKMRVHINEFTDDLIKITNTERSYRPAFI